MRKFLLPFAGAANLFLVSCQKDAEILTTEEKDLSLKNQVVSNTSTPVYNGMKNYESFFLSKEDGQVHGYTISLPHDYDPSKKYPLLMFLHGLGEKLSGWPYSYDKLKFHGPHKEIFYKNRSFPAIVVSYQLSVNDGDFNPYPIKELIDILSGTRTANYVNGGNVGLQKYSLDENRLHITGLSLGGHGVYKAAYTFPNLFASISVFAGYTGSQSQMSLITIPTFIRHCNPDNTVATSNATNARDWINKAANKGVVNLVLINNPYHDSWTNEYSKTDAGNVYDWHWSIYKNGATPTTTPPPTWSPEPTPALTDASAALTVSSFSPSINSVATAQTQTSLTLTFNNPVNKANGLIQVKNLTDNTVFTLYSSWGMVGVSGNKVTIYPIELKYGKKYSVRMAAGAFTDYSGKPSQEINNDWTWTFDAGTAVSAAEPVNTNPTLNSVWPSNNSSFAQPANGYIDLKLTFNKAMLKSNGKILVKNLTDNTTFTTYASWGMVSVNSNQAVVYPISVRAGNTYAVLIDPDTFKDTSNQHFSGINSTGVWTFKVY